MLISNKFLKIKELSRFDKMIDELYINTGIKIEIYKLSCSMLINVIMKIRKTDDNKACF